MPRLDERLVTAAEEPSTSTRSQRSHHNRRHKPFLSFFVPPYLRLGVEARGGAAPAVEALPSTQEAALLGHVVEVGLLFWIFLLGRGEGERSMTVCVAHATSRQMNMHGPSIHPSKHHHHSILTRLPSRLIKPQRGPGLLVVPPPAGVAAVRGDLACLGVFTFVAC